MIKNHPIDVRKLSQDELRTYIIEKGESKFRADQIYSWIWQKSATSFEEMTNLSKNLRHQLSDEFVFNPIEEDTVQRSSDGTIKSRFKLFDGHKIESVLIPVPKENRFTVCVSSQVGCSLTCKFCATGQMDRVRNLDASEIYDQIVKVNKQSLDTFGHPLTNIVYMGMGEPLLAYKNVLSSINKITSEKGLQMSSKRITVSTAGIAKMIRKLADDDVRFNLALSLHAADDKKRNELMPINESNTLDSLMESLEYFYSKTKNRISYEYIAFNGFNDSIEDAKNLVKLCRIFPVKVNVIEYNPVDGVDFVKSSDDRLDKFANYIKSKGITITVRRSRGKDIDAACGQLANKD